MRKCDKRRERQDKSDEIPSNNSTEDIFTR
jgi:hypothetical protein